MHSPIDIGPTLVRARKQSGMSQRELADRLGLKQPQIARWEASAYRNATLERVDAVARVLGVDVGVDSARLAAEASSRYNAGVCENARLLDRAGADQRALATVSSRYGIAEIALFGSVTEEAFGPQSDVDVLVRFVPGEHPALGRLLEVEDELRRVFGRDVDVVERSSVENSENHLRRRRILSTARTVYVA